MPDEEAAPPKNVPAESPAAASPPAEAPPAPMVEDWETRFKYLFADFENFRKRTARESAQVRERTRADILRVLLPLHEAFQKARESVSRLPASDPVRRGMDLLEREWSAFLEGEGVRPLATPGGLFRPEEQEAVAEAPVSTAHHEGTIVEVVQQGYRFTGGLLRPAKVVVARKPPAPPTPTTKTRHDETPEANPSAE